MKGLIKKDLFMIRSNCKILLILFIVYLIMTIEGNDFAMFLLPFMSIMLMISTFSYDSYNKWTSYAITLPNGREKSVRAKYLATLLIALVTTIFTLILLIAVSYFKTNTINMEEILENMLGMLFGIFVIQAFMYPSIYKFGVEKARIGIFILVFGVAIIGGVLSKLFDFSKIADMFKFLNQYSLIVIPLAMFGLLYLSYKVSEKIYQKKEF